LTANNLIIREFEDQDCDGIFKLAAELGLSPWSLSDYRAELKRRDSEMLVVLNDSKPVGFIIGRRVPGSGPGNAPDAEIYNIGVAPDVQRCGIGSRLLSDFIERCRREAVHDVWLEVRSGNSKAIRFYKRFGFSKFAVRSGFYRDPPDDGIVMRLTLI
jgi:ribosomal-protein-alanine N-acetyltransferase